MMTLLSWMLFLIGVADDNFVVYDDVVVMSKLLTSLLLMMALLLWVRCSCEQAIDDDDVVMGAM